jgi:hypothetical protein
MRRMHSNQSTHCLISPLLPQDIERDLNDTDKRRGTWAMQQREVFRRQRQEVAERYARAGVPERRAYSAMQANRKSVLETSTHAGSYGQQAEEHSLPLPSSRPLPRPSYPSVYPKTSKPGADLIASVYEVACMRQCQAGEEKEAAENRSQLKALEEFERSLEMMQKNSRSSYEDHSQYPVISALRAQL